MHLFGDENTTLLVFFVNLYIFYELKVTVGILNLERKRSNNVKDQMLLWK